MEGEEVDQRQWALEMMKETLRVEPMVGRAAEPAEKAEEVGVGAGSEPCRRPRQDDDFRGQGARGHPWLGLRGPGQRTQGGVPAASLSLGIACCVRSGSTNWTARTAMPQGGQRVPRRAELAAWTQVRRRRRQLPRSAA